MPAQPVNPQLTKEVQAPCKQQVSLNDNGKPVDIPNPKQKKSAPGNTAKAKATPVPKKSSAMKAVPAKATLPKWKPSVEIEDVVDEDNTISSQQPQNPQNILEVADWSDDDNEYDVPAPAAMSVDGNKEEEMVKIIEPPGEDNEAELGLYHSST